MVEFFRDSKHFAPKLLYGLLFHEFFHQVPHCPICIHQLGLRTDEIIRRLAHATEERVFKYPWALIHPVRSICGERKHFSAIPGY